MTRLFLFALTLIAAAASPLQARKWQEFRQVTATEGFVPTSDRAYILVRVRRSSVGWLAPTLLRIPKDSEVRAFLAAKRADYDRKKRDVPFEQYPFEDSSFNNFYGFDLGKTVANDGNTRTYLLDVEPGQYILAGVGNIRAMWTCFCQGSVQIVAQPGVISDAGTILFEPADRPASDPELATVTGLGSMARMDFLMFAGAIRPFRTGDPRPAALSSHAVVEADYRAAAPFVLQAALLANFLAPMPGVLDYRRGEVFDVKANALLPPR